MGMSHNNRTELSKEPETIRPPSVENATKLTPLVCPCRSLSCSLVLASHTRTELSLESETIRLPSVEKATEVAPSLCPCNSLTCSPIFASQTRTDSEPVETSRLPSDKNVHQWNWKKAPCKGIHYIIMRTGSMDSSTTPSPSYIKWGETISQFALSLYLWY